jgi:hypothetical protein
VWDANEIGTWQGFRQGAVTYTFDDDLPNQYSIAIPMFNAKGFKMTLFTVTTWLPGGSWTPVQTAASFGHEVASHTVTHPYLGIASDTTVTNELENSQTAINANVTSQKCVTIAYPYCNPPANIAAVANCYIAARGCSGELVPATPANFMNISSFMCGTQGLLQYSDIVAKADAAAAAGSWCVYLIHAIDNEGNGYSPLPSTTLQASLNYLSANQSKFWVETFGHVFCYIRERDAASVLETSNTGDSITLQVTDDLDDSIYNYPITLRRPLPAKWPGAAVSQNNKSIPAQLINLNSTNYVMCDVVPNGGDVTLTKQVVTVMISAPVLTAASLNFRLNGQPGARYAIYESSNLVSWAPVQTNILLDTYTNWTVAAPTAIQFYRVQWAP